VSKEYASSVYAETVAVWDDLTELNREIQDFLSTRGMEVPMELVKLLSDLDWLLYNSKKDESG
jgi:hypothetical protein